MEQRTRCPEVEVVERYVRGELPATAAAEFRSHLEVCGVCSLIVQRLQELDAVGQTVSPGPEPDWHPMERRLAAECQRLYSGKARQSGRPTWGWWFPALGYALALVLLYPAWLGISRRPSAASAPAPVAGTTTVAASAATIVDLNTTRSVQSLPAVIERLGETAAVLTFFVPAVAGTQLSVAIVDSANHVVLEFGEIRGSDDQGNYCVVVNPRSLPLGEYRLTARDRNRPAEVGSSFKFVRR